MKRHPIKGEQIRQYLLGTLDPKSNDLLEERLLTDDDLLEEVSAMENDMVFEYLTGGFPEQEKERFVNYFLSTPERQRKLKFFGALKQGLEKLPAESDAVLPRSWKRFLPAFLRGDGLWPQLSLATVAVLLIFGVAWLVPGWRGRMPGDDRAVTAAFTITLSPGGTRGAGELTRVVVPEGVETVELRLPLAGGSHPVYRAVLVMDGNVEKFVSEDLPAVTTDKVRTIIFRVPSVVLTRGEYRVKLLGLGPGKDWEGVETYPLRVVQEQPPQ